jgi:hypothetical protein
LRRLGDAAHRFAVSFHRQLRGERMKRSRLSDIPGLGPKRVKELLAHFRSIDAIQLASQATLAAAPGVGPVLAGQIWQYFHPQAAEQPSDDDQFPANQIPADQISADQFPADQGCDDGLDPIYAAGLSGAEILAVSERQSESPEDCLAPTPEGAPRPMEFQDMEFQDPAAGATDPDPRLELAC